jgi:hypothetical protein
MRVGMGPDAPLEFRPAGGSNRWTLEPVLFLLPWIFAGTLALSFLLAYAGTASAFAGSVAIFIAIWLGVGVLWAGLEHATRARGPRQSP